MAARTLKRFKARALARPEVRKAYDDVEGEFAFPDVVRPAYGRSGWMATKRIKNVLEAGREFRALVEAARRGMTTIIARHGKPVAAIVPLSQATNKSGGGTAIQLRGTGKNIWKRDIVEKGSRQREEWK